MTLALILSADPDTPLAQLCRGFDFYELALAFEDGGIKLAWDRVLALETCGQVQGLLGEAV